MTQKTDNPATPSIPAPSDFPIYDSDIRSLPSSRSTIYARVPLDVRDKLDRAIADYDPPTYRACYKQFALAGYGVKYSAFYLYARKLRAVIDRCRYRLLNRPDEEEMRSLLPALAAERLFDCLAAPDAPSRDVARLARAWVNAVKADVQRAGPAADPRYQARVAVARIAAQSDVDCADIRTRAVEMDAESRAECVKINADSRAECARIAADSRAAVAQINSDTRAEVLRIDVEGRAEVARIAAQSRADSRFPDAQHSPNKDVQEVK